MNRTATLAAAAAGLFCAAALAQAPPPATSPAPSNSQSSAPSQKQTPPPPQQPGATQPRKPGAPVNSDEGQSPDPSSTRGRPDASYPNPSGQDTRTDAAARPHTEDGHDHTADTNKVDPTPSAGPNSRQGAYTGASGKKQNPDTACETPTASPPQGRSANPGAANNAAECVDTRRDAERSQSRRASAPPGATAPMPK